MTQVSRITYMLGWIFFVLAVLERIVLWFSAAAVPFASGYNIVPRNILSFALILFVITIASEVRGRGAKA